MNTTDDHSAKFQSAVTYTDVTELAGDEVTREQVERHAHRYYWAEAYCGDKDVLEAACGNGQGLGYLAGKAGSITAGDISPELLARARSHYGARIALQRLDAHRLPFADSSLDVVILFEAIYYLASPERFVEECRRVLRPGGLVLIATANKDLFDFNPSPYASRYLGTVELNELFRSHGFGVELFGYLPVNELPLRQRVARPVKKLAVLLRMMPLTMAGKKFLKRIVFGSLVEMPPEIKDGMIAYQPPAPLDGSVPDRRHKVIYCAARVTSQTPPTTSRKPPAG